MRRLCPRMSRHQRVRRRFRASNDGKFPSKSYVYQQVGGSYYTVREVLQELEYNHTKIPLGNVKAAPLQRTVEAAEHSRPNDETMVAQHKGKSEVDENLRVSFNNSQEMQDVDDVLISHKDAATSIEIVEKVHPSLLSLSSKLTVHFLWHVPNISIGQLNSWFKTEAAKHDQNNSETFRTADGPTLSDQTESESMKVITNKSSVSLGVEAGSDPGNQQRETEANKLCVGSSHHNVETEAAKHDLKISETFKTADGPTLSDQTESESMKVITDKSSVSLGVEAKSDPGNQQRETETKELSLENTEKILNASESSVSDQSGSDKVIKANEHDREHNQKHEADESTSTGLFGTLKSFAYGFRNFWKKL
ncbi:hypothetical protein HU200_007393 [Digitaria exilis]|uniref:AT3G52170-like helix-turn-helix domain-containing protein n=1 Tax=Digitaria exilis TaxID=1010633 RepID=A0A835KSQ4_9POAL|nr:hypothetical protein HU200_007393 [Digitaria exilis]